MASIIFNFYSNTNIGKSVGNNTNTNDINTSTVSSSYTNKEGTKVYKTEVVVSSFEYMENRDPSGEVVNVDSFASFGVEDIEF